MRHSNGVFLLAAFAAIALPAAPLSAGVIPPIGLAPGTPYQLVFVTQDGITGTAGTEAPYNAFVNAEAALSPTLPSAIWSAITSTADGTAANLNAPSGGLPVYNTAGQLVASAATGIYTSALDTPIAYDQFGNPATGDPPLFASTGAVWTGSLYTGGPVLPMGTGNPTSGTFVLQTSGWADSGSFNPVFSLQVYALSSPITSTPEPATLTLLGSALLLLGGIQLLRWRRRVAG
jgi:hypothetical protein